MTLDTEKLYLLLNDKWLDMGYLWQKAFRRRIGLEGPPPKTDVALNSLRRLWDDYLKDMGIVNPMVEVYFLGRESEHYFVENPSKGWMPHGPSGSRDIWKLGIPKELATKAIILGYFPDSPSLENLRKFAHEP